MTSRDGNPFAPRTAPVAPTGGIARTKYRGPTDTTGSRIIATGADGARVTVEYDPALDAMENHATAAARVANLLRVPDAVPLLGGRLPGEQELIWLANHPAGELAAALRDVLALLLEYVRPDGDDAMPDASEAERAAINAARSVLDDYATSNHARPEGR